MADDLDDIFLDKKKKHIDKYKVINMKEIVLEDEALVDGPITSTGLVEFIHFTGMDKNRISGQFLLNANLTRPAKVMSYEFLYGHKLKTFWLENFLSFTITNFHEISEQKSNTSSTNAANEANFYRDNSTNETIISGGIGLGYRSKLISDLTNQIHIFESIKAYLTYYSMNDKLKNETYTGPGIRTDFGIHQRVSSTFYYGAKLSYNLGMVSRSKSFELEKDSDRSLTISWFALGIDFGLYF